jgi:hypothetical protein
MSTSKAHRRPLPIAMLAVLSLLLAMVATVATGSRPAGATVIPAASDAVASAPLWTLSAGAQQVDSDNTSATATDTNADAVVAQAAASHVVGQTLWYRLAPGPGRITIAVESHAVTHVAAALATEPDGDSFITNPQATFSAIQGVDVTVNDTENAEGLTARADTSAADSPAGFAFTADVAHIVADGNHSYYLGFGTDEVGAADPTGSITVSITYVPAPDNDNYPGATIPSATTTASFTGDTTGATPGFDDTSTPDDPMLQTDAAHSVWYQWTAATTGPFTVSLSTAAGQLPAVFGVYGPHSSASDSPPSNAQPIVGSGTSSPFETSARYWSYPGQVFYIMIDGQQDANNIPQSGPYDMTLTTAVAPANDDVNNASVLPSHGLASVTGTNVNASARYFESNDGGDTAGEEFLGVSFNNFQQHSVFYSFTPTKSGDVVVYTSGPLDTDLAVFDESNFFASRGENDNYTTSGTFSRLSFQAVAGTLYLIGVDGSSAANYPVGSFGLHLDETPVNNSVSGASYLAKTTKTVVTHKKHKRHTTKVISSKASGSVRGSTVFADHQTGEKALNGGAADLWYTFVAPKAGSYKFTETLTGGRALLAGYSATKSKSNLGLKLVNDAAAVVAGKPVSIVLKAKAGQSFLIAVDGRSGDFGAYSLAWKP